MDMWVAYQRNVRDCVQDGDLKIVFDPFHVMRHVIEAMHQVLSSQNRVLRHQGDHRLPGTKFLWFKTRVTRPDFAPGVRRQFRRLPRRVLKSPRAWATNETFGSLWDYRSTRGDIRGRVRHRVIY